MGKLGRIAVKGSRKPPKVGRIISVELLVGSERSSRERTYYSTRLPNEVLAEEGVCHNN